MRLLGILIVLLSISLLFIPLFGGYLTILPGIMAIFVGRKGALLALISVVVNGVHIMLLSDFIRFNAVMGIQHGEYRATVIYIGLALLQVIAGLVIWMRHYPIGISKTTTSAPPD